MKQRLYAIAFLTGVFFLLLSVTLVMPESNNANVTIPANQEFVLGEFENANYRARLQNQGGVVVEVDVLDKESNIRTQSLALDGQTTLNVSIRKNEKVILRNNNDKTVTVKVKLSRNVEGMRYQSLSDVD